MYARYRTRSRFYKQPERPLKAYGVSPNVLRQPRISKRGLLHGVYADQTVDLRDKERLELLEEIRHPRERDFYQDHTYHNQWIDRDLEPHQKSQIASRYKYFDPDFAIKPWLWYPGDMVEVVSGGEQVGQRGTIIAVVPYKNEIIVQHVNIKDIVIPASDTRPEQIVQREHPISVDNVKHVDPSTGKTCTLAMVKVYAKGTQQVEERRISLDSGVLLPIPPRDSTSSLETGDPLRDTPIQDAEEETYDSEAELPLLVDRKLKAMENYFTQNVLKSSYEFHQPFHRANALEMRKFQSDVVKRATTLLGAAIAKRAVEFGAATEVGEEDKSEVGTSRDSGTDGRWWATMLSPYMEEIYLQEEEAHELQEERERQAAEQAKAAQTPAARSDLEDDDDDFDEDDDEDEEEEVEEGQREEDKNSRK